MHQSAPDGNIKKFFEPVHKESTHTKMNNFGAAVVITATVMIVLTEGRWDATPPGCSRRERAKALDERPTKLNVTDIPAFRKAKNPCKAWNLKMYRRTVFANTTTENTLRGNWSEMRSTMSMSVKYLAELNIRRIGDGCSDWNLGSIDHLDVLEEIGAISTTHAERLNATTSTFGRTELYRAFAFLTVAFKVSEVDWRAETFSYHPDDRRHRIPKTFKALSNYCRYMLCESLGPDADTIERRPSIELKTEVYDKLENVTMYHHRSMTLLRMRDCSYLNILKDIAAHMEMMHRR